MTGWQIALLIVSIILLIALLFALMYFIILPKIIVKKFRSGEDGISFPENYKEYEENVIITRDLIYPSQYTDCTYDLYRPKNQDKPLPLIIWVHGGFFIAGDKSGTRNVCTILAANDFVVASLNYKRAPEAKYPSQVKQLNDFTKIISTIENIDSNKIILAGDSAGGQIVCQYSCLLANKELQSTLSIFPNIELAQVASTLLVCAPIDISLLFNISPKLDKLLPIFGRAFFGCGKWHKKEKYNSSKLYNYINDSFPKTILTDGNTFSFEKQNLNLAKLLKENNVDVDEIFFTDTNEKINHEYLFDLKLEVAQTALNRIIAILKKLS